MAKRQVTLAELTAQIAELNKQADELRAKEKREVVSQIRQAIETYGITPDDLFAPKRKRRSDAGVTRGAKKKPAGKKKPAAKVQFRHEANEWSGRGPRPMWLRELVEAGRDPEEFRVSK